MVIFLQYVRTNRFSLEEVLIISHVGSESHCWLLNAVVLSFMSTRVCPVSCQVLRKPCDWLKILSTEIYFTPSTKFCPKHFCFSNRFEIYAWDTSRPVSDFKLCPLFLSEFNPNWNIEFYCDSSVDFHENMLFPCRGTGRQTTETDKERERERERERHQPYRYMKRRGTKLVCTFFTFLTLRLLISYIYIYMEHPFLMFLDHTQRRTYAYGRSPAEIVGSNPTGGMDICLLWVSCVVR